MDYAATNRRARSTVLPVMTAGASLLPDIALMLVLVLAVIMACTYIILDNFYSPAQARGRTKHHRRVASPIQRWIVRTAADFAANMLSQVEAAIGSVRTQRGHQVRHCRPSGNLARYTARAHAVQLTRRGSAIKGNPRRRSKSVIARIKKMLGTEQRL
jgi:hypothetical protein